MNTSKVEKEPHGFMVYAGNPKCHVLSSRPQLFPTTSRFCWTGLPLEDFRLGVSEQMESNPFGVQLEVEEKPAFCRGASCPNIPMLCNMA